MFKRCLIAASTVQTSLLMDKMVSAENNTSDPFPQCLDDVCSHQFRPRLVPQGQKASDYDNSDPVPPRQNVVPTA
ncbi:hypothetical protein Tco_0361977, partial [Tanacetum coccineum]